MRFSKSCTWTDPPLAEAGASGPMAARAIPEARNLLWTQIYVDLLPLINSGAVSSTMTPLSWHPCAFLGKLLT